MRYADVRARRQTMEGVGMRQACRVRMWGMSYVTLVCEEKYGAAGGGGERGNGKYENMAHVPPNCRARGRGGA